MNKYVNIFSWLHQKQFMAEITLKVSGETVCGKIADLDDAGLVTIRGDVAVTYLDIEEVAMVTAIDDDEQEEVSYTDLRIVRDQDGHERL